MFLASLSYITVLFLVGCLLTSLIVIPHFFMFLFRWTTRQHHLFAHSFIHLWDLHSYIFKHGRWWSHGAKNSRKIGFMTHLFPKGKQWGVSKLNSFGELIGQSSHVPIVLNYVCIFWFCPEQKWILHLELVMWHGSLYIFYSFNSSLSYILTPSWTAFTLLRLHCLRHFTMYR